MSIAAVLEKMSRSAGGEDYRFQASGNLKNAWSVAQGFVTPGSSFEAR
jgi:hypothetical protein